MNQNLETWIDQGVIETGARMWYMQGVHFDPEAMSCSAD
jgi:hypothetical protein